MKDFGDKMKLCLPVSGMFFMMFGILGPLDIYAGNPNEFEFGMNDFFWMFLGVYFLIWLVGSAALCLLPDKILGLVLRILFVLSLELYLQNMFLNKVLIRPDGSSLDWTELKDLTAVNTIVWAAAASVLFLGIWKLKERWKKAITYVSVFLLLVQGVAVISLLVTVPKDRSYQNECRIDATRQFGLANGGNIIVFVLDRYANDQFNLDLEENPQMYGILKDFTYYDNADSGGVGTDWGLAYLLTGCNPLTDEEWENNTWSSGRAQSFYDALHRNGYVCYLSTRDSNSVFVDMNYLVGKFDNVRPLEARLDRGLLLRLMTKITIYKYVPYIMKPRFEVITQDFKDVVTPEQYRNSLYLNPEFYQALKDEGFYIDDDLGKLFKVQHIQGMHGDYNMNGSAMEIPEEDGTAKQSRDGLNVILEEYLDQLKALGLYDDAFIFITADHGDSSHEFGLQPAVLVKQSGERHDRLQIDHAPIAHGDFIPTVLNYIGEDGTAFGTSIYDWKEGDRRERTLRVNQSIFTYYTDGKELEQIAVDY